MDNQSDPSTGTSGEVQQSGVALDNGRLQYKTKTSYRWKLKEAHAL